MKLALGAVTVFKGTADFNGNSVVVTENMSTDDDSFRRFSQAGRKGGAIHNKVSNIKSGFGQYWLCMQGICLALVSFHHVCTLLLGAVVVCVVSYYIITAVPVQ